VGGGSSPRSTWSSAPTRSTVQTSAAGVAIAFRLGRRPDFVCEILSESNAATDQVDKFRVYAASGVPFYWIGDPERKILTVYRLEGTGYAVALQAKRGEVVNAPPFDALALRVGLLFGEDPD
jgi:Uma2 family endonuclease